MTEAKTDVIAGIRDPKGAVGGGTSRGDQPYAQASVTARVCPKSVGGSTWVECGGRKGIGSQGS
jgi:hypothetical protein